MNLYWKQIGLLLLGGLMLVAGNQCAQAVVIFEDDFTTRLAAGEIAGSTPNIVTNGAQYAYQVQSNVEAKIENTGIGQALSFNTGYGLDSVYLPYYKNMVGSTDILRLTLTFRKPSGTYNNFSFGFAGTGTSGMAGGNFYLYQDNYRVVPWVAGTDTNTAGPYTRLDVSFPTSSASYSNAVTPVSATSLVTYTLEYDPSNVATQPWSLAVNGEMAPLRKGANAVYAPLTEIGGITFGQFNALSDGTHTRTTWLTNMKFEVVPEPSSIVLLGLGAVGLAIVARKRLAAR